MHLSSACTLCHETFMAFIPQSFPILEKVHEWWYATRLFNSFELCKGRSSDDMQRVFINGYSQSAYVVWIWMKHMIRKCISCLQPLLWWIAFNCWMKYRSYQICWFPHCFILPGYTMEIPEVCSLVTLWESIRWLISEQENIFSWKKASINFARNAYEADWCHSLMLYKPFDRAVFMMFDTCQQMYGSQLPMYPFICSLNLCWQHNDTFVIILC